MKWQIDFLSLSAHKFYGPQGMGLAYINKAIKINPLIVVQMKIIVYIDIYILNPFV